MAEAWQLYFVIPDGDHRFSMLVDSSSTMLEVANLVSDEVGHAFPQFVNGCRLSICGTTLSPADTIANVENTIIRGAKVKIIVLPALEQA